MVKMTKKNEGLLDNYQRAWATELWDVYGSCSYAKREAFNDCKRHERAFNGYDGRICTWNSQTFTYAFRYEGIDPKTDELHEYLRYYTAWNTYEFEIA